MSSISVSPGASASKSTYDDDYAAEMIPEITGSPTYGFLPSNFRSFEGSGGSAGVSGRLFETSSGNTIFGYGALQSFRTLRYKVGQGALCRFGAIFPSAPTALTWLGAGLVNLGDELTFGYNGLDFGIWHRHNGEAEIKNLQVTTAAGGSETATVTINDIVFTIPLTVGTEAHNAWEIATYIEANTELWNADQLDDSVIISAASDAPKTGTFSFSSTGSAVATFTTLNTGVTKTSDFVAQDNWNGETVPTDFNPAQGNNYQISFKDGFGNLMFYIEDPVTGSFKLVHTIQWANLNAAANLGNPSLRCGCYAYSIGSTTDVKVQMTDISSFVIGSDKTTRNPRNFSNTKSIGTTLTNILTVKNRRVYNNNMNQIEIQPKQLVISNDGGKTAIFELRANPTVAGEPNYQNIGNNLASLSEIAGTTVSSNGRSLGSYPVAKGGSLIIDLVKLNIAMPPTLRLVLAGKMTSGSSADLSASLVYYENV